MFNVAEKLFAIIERITFHSQDTGFCVLRTQVKGQRDLVTVIGNAVNIAVGESIEAEGMWHNDKVHGLQFKATQLRIVAPTTLEGIEKYLGSGLVKGIGPHYAKILVQAFGVEVFDVIEKTPERLLQLSGIGAKRKEQILSGWHEQQTIRRIMVFLQSHGVSASRAVRIYKTYGDAAIEKVQQDPYCLALDIYGIGFKTADKIAEKLGVPKDSPQRVGAGVRHALQEFSSGGHCGAWQSELEEAAMLLLEVSQERVSTAILEEVNQQRLMLEEIEDKNALFLATLYQCEVSVAERLHSLMRGKIPWGKLDTLAAIPWVEKATGLTLSQSQAAAITQALKTKVMIITGGPGVGKTTIVNSILKILAAKHVRVALCAPTGRAAKRLTETTGMLAKTIHRLLEFDPLNFGFKNTQENPLPIDFLVVDEASMLDVVLLNHLLKAIPNRAALLLIGDVDQLPSVGPGAVLADLIATKAIPTVFLTEIFRQAASSHIIINAHRINQGQMPLETENSDLKDFYFIPADSPEETHDKVLHLVAERIPQRFGFHPIQDIQVLTPMNRGGVGTKALNTALQAKLNFNPTTQVMRFGITFALGDKVMQRVNNYDKDIFNGDIGHITGINFDDNIITISFDGKNVEYDFNELDEITLAYATSIHKSQGSEYPVVVIPVAMQHYRMLARNLLYTGVTRGKKLVILVGEVKALGIAVRRAESGKRLTRLTTRLLERVNYNVP